MKDRHTDLLESLAAKFGTTTEYLWGVLINQAKYEAITLCLQFTLLIVATVVFTLLVKRRLNADAVEDGEGIAYLIIGVTIAILDFNAFFYIPELISAIFNPEYWALKEILNAIN